MNSITRAALAVSCVLLWPGAGRAQFTSGVQAVEVYASVVDRTGAPVRGLGRQDFEVFEDGVLQPLTAFTAGEFPLTVAVALDRSFSMAGRPLAATRAGVRRFLAALRPSDESLVIGIGSEVSPVAPVEMPRDRQMAAVDAVTAWGTTSLHDAVVASIEAVDAARGRRALVILSDGDDRYSKATAQEAVARARRSNVMIYPIATGRSRPPLFAELATVTGGRSHHARDLKGLDTVLTAIARDLREQYLLGYSPARAAAQHPSEWRSITVRVKRPGLTVRARDGYYGTR